MADSKHKFFSFKFVWHLSMSIVSLVLLLSYLAPFIHPETLSLLAFFGLGYLYILLLSVIALIVTIIKKSRWKYVLGSLLLIGINLHFRTIAWGGNTELTDENSLKVMSYNVRLFDRYNPNVNEAQSTKNEILKYIETNQPELVCFQEFYHQDNPTSFKTKDTLLKIFNTKQYHERYQHKTNGRQNFGVFILSVYPIIEKGDIVFDQPLKSNNYCIYSDIVVKKDTFRIYNVHLQSIHLQRDDYALFDEEDPSHGDQSSNIFKLFNKIRLAYPIRAKQAEEVAAHIKKSPYPVIVCGDFNDSPMSYSYNQFNSILTDAFRNCSFGLGATYAGKIPAGRIDYIFHDRSLNSTNFKIQEDPLSDHRAISCTIFKPLK